MAKIDVFFDVICPWCYIGKRRLERMMALRPDYHAEITWRAFELNPGMPKAGIERQAYLDMKFGSRERAIRIYDAIGQAGQKENIPFRFDLIQRTPNTIPAHSLLRVARLAECENELLQCLFTAYFEQGLDIGDPDTLRNLGKSVGLGEREIETWPLHEQEVIEDLKIRNRIGGVPHFIFAGKYSLAGAQEPEILLRLYDLAQMEEGLSSSF